MKLAYRAAVGLSIINKIDYKLAYMLTVQWEEVYILCITYISFYARLVYNH